MAIRRTQEQKERAVARKMQYLEENPVSLSRKGPQHQAATHGPVTQRTTIADILHTDTALLKKDLLKTSLITLLLLGCIFGIFIYLR